MRAIPFEKYSIYKFQGHLGGTGFVIAAENVANAYSAKVRSRLIMEAGSLSLAGKDVYGYSVNTLLELMPKDRVFSVDYMMTCINRIKNGQEPPWNRM